MTIDTYKKIQYEKIIGIATFSIIEVWSRKLHQERVFGFEYDQLDV